jgi:hypothetical protein
MMLLNYIRHKKTIAENTMDFYTSNGIHVYFKDPIKDNDVDIEECVVKAESVLPNHLLDEVEMIIVGHFDEFDERSLTAFYDGGTLYISPEHESQEDAFSDIVHEIAHSLEEPYGALIYQDSKIEKEFLDKRINLHKILWELGFKVPETVFLETEYNEEFDMFLYEDVGYDRLAIVTQGIFVSPYAATSLREYFATGFSEYYTDPNHSYLKTTCPQLYKKILLLQDKEALDNSY